MTRSEYQDLVEFLGRRFDAMDGRFDAMDGRLTRVEVLAEDNRHQIQLLAEGITAVDHKLDRFRDHVTEEFRAVRAEMADGFRFQAKLSKSLGARMDRWEGQRA